MAKIRKAIITREDLDKIDNLDEITKTLNNVIELVTEGVKTSIQDFLDFMTNEERDSIIIACSDLLGIKEKLTDTNERERVDHSIENFSGQIGKIPKDEKGLWNGVNGALKKSENDLMEFVERVTPFMKVIEHRLLGFILKNTNILKYSIIKPLIKKLDTSEKIRPHITGMALEIAENDDECMFEDIYLLLNRSEEIQEHHFWIALTIAKEDESCGDVSHFLMTLANEHKVEPGDRMMRKIQKLESRM